MNKQKIIVVIIAMAMMGTLFTTDVSRVYAQDNSTTHRATFFQDLAQYISQKFGLDKTKVQLAVDEYQKTQKATITPRSIKTADELLAEQKARLDKFVADGKITSTQETLIINQLAVIRTKYSADTLKNLTAEQRRAKMTEMRDEIIAWAKANNIDSSYLNQGFGRGERGFHDDNKIERHNRE